MQEGQLSEEGGAAKGDEVCFAQDEQPPKSIPNGERIPLEDWQPAVPEIINTVRPNSKKRDIRTSFSIPIESATRAMCRADRHRGRAGKVTHLQIGRAGE